MLEMLEKQKEELEVYQRILAQVGNIQPQAEERIVVMDGMLEDDFDALQHDLKTDWEVKFACEAYLVLKQRVKPDLSVLFKPMQDMIAEAEKEAQQIEQGKGKQ